MVGAGRADEIRALARTLWVPWAEDGGTKAIAPRQRVQVLGDGVDSVVVGVTVLGRVRHSRGRGGRRLLEILGRKLEAIEKTLPGAVLVGESSSDAAGSQKEQLGG